MITAVEITAAAGTTEMTAAVAGTAEMEAVAEMTAAAERVAVTEMIPAAAETADRRGAATRFPRHGLTVDATTIPDLSPEGRISPVWGTARAVDAIITTEARGARYPGGYRAFHKSEKSV